MQPDNHPHRAHTAPHILIVDNDDRIVELVSWFLTKKGFSVSSAASFTETRQLLGARMPDLMLSDVDLGAESALDELPRLAQDGLLPPTLVVSGYLDPATAVSLEALEPVLGTLAKPFDFPVLEDRIDGCLRELGAHHGAELQKSVVPQVAPGIGGASLAASGTLKTSQTPSPVDPSPNGAREAGAAGAGEWVEILPVGRAAAGNS